MNSAAVPSTIEPNPAAGPNDFAALLAIVADLDREIAEVEHDQTRLLAQLHPAQRASALNLLHYLRLRRRDLRPVQTSLAALGLSSLGRCEAHVFESVRAVHHALSRLGAAEAQAPPAPPLPSERPGDLLERHAATLLGPGSSDRNVRIMVTMPSEAAQDGDLVFALLQHGMECMRINCAHDDPAAWERMIANLRRAEAKSGRRCRVIMDLAGPKLRTGSLTPGPEVVKWRPTRDQLGRPSAPAKIWLTPEDDPRLPESAADAVLPLERRLLSHLMPGRRLRLRDARGKQRELKVTRVVGDSRWAESFETVYATSGMALKPIADASLVDLPEGAALRVGALPAAESFILLREGDRLEVTADPSPGRPELRDAAGSVVERGVISCSLPEVFAFVKSGERVWFDDGKIGGVIRRADRARWDVEIVRAPPGGAKLRSDKGINLPDSDLRLPALTAKDRADLDFVAAHADLVGYSFVHSVDDVIELQRLLAERRPEPPGIVLKIETRLAFEKLPDLLLAAMRSPIAGVMIARGDLGVECGFERLAEVQEEILWICEAAHVPVIWATQVLESLAKNGMPSRAEVTDAAMGVRAECVMLNKGPYIVEAVQTLDDILRRMEEHQNKKSPTLRPLGVAKSFTAPTPTD